MPISTRVRSLLIGVGLLVACSGSRSAPDVLAGSGGTPDAGAAPASDSGTPDAGSVDAGAPDAGKLDGGSSDAGDDAGTADAGADAGRAATIDCAPFGAAKLAWTLTGYQNPWNLYDANSYLPRATDTLDGVLVTHFTESGHFSGSADATYGPDGGLRVDRVGGSSCHPVQGCFFSSKMISNGTIYEAAGIASALVENGGIARSAQDGHIIYQFEPAPVGADAGAYWVEEGVAANGRIAVFTWSDYKTPTSTVTALDSDGGTIWQHTFPHAVEAAAVDDTGITLLRMSYAGDLVAFAPDGGELYSQTPDMNLRNLQAAGGRFYLGGRTLYRIADGSELMTLPVAPSDSPLLTASRAYVWENDTVTGRSILFAIDPATGNTLWARTLRQTTFAVFAFSVTAERAVIIDPQDVLHVLQDDGTDLLACKVAPDVRSPVLLRGGRLALQRYPNLEVYDLPY